MGIVDPKNCAEVRLHLDERADTIRLEITMRRDAFNEGCADFDAFLAHHQRQVPEPYTKDADLHLIQSFAWAYEMFYTVDATSMPAPTCLPELRKVMDRCPPVQPDVAPLGENSVDLQGDNSPLAVPRGGDDNRINAHILLVIRGFCRYLRDKPTGNDDEKVPRKAVERLSRQYEDS